MKQTTTETTKKVYTAPALIVHGSVTEITHGGTTGAPDGNFGSV